MNYSFVRSENLELSFNTSFIMSLSDSFSGEEQTKIQGQLLTLFGEPICTTPNYEEAYEYIILAKSSDGTEIVLTVYSGSSGAAIGGDWSIQGIEDIAAELKKYVQQADTSDFEYEGYYLDGPTKVHMKIENGVISYSETELNEQEYQKAMDMCYPKR